jgi:hypothetical protein
MFVALREINNRTVHCLELDTLQLCVDSISSHLAVFRWTICSTFADSMLHRNETCILISTVNCWGSGNAKGCSAPTCIACIWLLSSVAVVGDKFTYTLSEHSLSSLMDTVQYYPDVNVFSSPSSSTFKTGPSSDITGGRFGVPIFHNLSGLSVVLFPAHRNPMNRLLKDKLFSWFSSFFRLCITLYTLFS